jgi:HK97 gp10 family phage protein
VSRGANSVHINVDMGQLDTLLDQLGNEVEAATRPAAQAAAQVLYDDVRANVARIGTKTGNLSRSIYQVFSKDNSPQGRATYHISWNARTAPHGHLVEYGHLQRYRMYQDKRGNVRPMVRAGMEGKPRPGRRASQAAKDAYYVTLPTPIQVAARPFIRPAVQKFNVAVEAAKEELLKRLYGAGVA